MRQTQWPALHLYLLAVSVGRTPLSAKSSAEKNLSASNSNFLGVSLSPLITLQRLSQIFNSLPTLLAHLINLL